MNRAIGDAVETSGSSLDQLVRIDLREMRCHKRHTGQSVDRRSGSALSDRLLFPLSGPHGSKGWRGHRCVSLHFLEVEWLTRPAS
jgi:hypothetical protein